MACARSVARVNQVRCPIERSLVFCSCARDFPSAVPGTLADYGAMLASSPIVGLARAHFRGNRDGIQGIEPILDAWMALAATRSAASVVDTLIAAGMLVN